VVGLDKGGPVAPHDSRVSQAHALQMAPCVAFMPSQGQSNEAQRYADKCDDCVSEHEDISSRYRGGLQVVIGMAITLQN
jgi:hypothetical protein